MYKDLNNLFNERAKINSNLLKDVERNKVHFLKIQIECAKQIYGGVNMNGHDIEYVRVTKSALLKVIENYLSTNEYDRIDLENFWFQTDNPKVIYIN